MTRSTHNHEILDAGRTDGGVTSLDDLHFTEFNQLLVVNSDAANHTRNGPGQPDDLEIKFGSASRPFIPPEIDWDWSIRIFF